MKMRVLSVVVALAVMAGLPFAGARLLPLGPVQHRRPATTKLADAAHIAQVRRYPREYVGVVSNDVAAFDRRCNCRPNAAIHYIPIGGPVSMSLARLVLEARAVPVLELEPFGIPLSRIIAGGEDAWLTRYAKAVLSLKAPVLLSFAPEANGSWYEWGFRHTTARVYVTAWRHVVTVFRKAGAGQMKWVWIMNRGFLQGQRLQLLWPGQSYVNMLGIDGYFKNPAENFRNLFASTIRDMRNLSSDPILISETGGGPTAGKLRAVRQLVSGVAAYHLAGFIWFDIPQHGDPAHQDWRIETDPRALTAYQGAIQGYASPVT
jgi:mannan endo-1,4-beta-mannosidase